MEIFTPKPLTARELGNSILPGAWQEGAFFLSSQISSPLLLAVVARTEQVASAGDWQLHTQERGPDLTEAGTFLEEEGFSKECSPQLASRRGAALTGLIGLPDLCLVNKAEK